MNKFLEFYNTRKGKIIIFSILGIGVLALIIGLIIGAVTTASEGASELNNLSIAEIRGRISSEYIIPEFENYHANGKLVFNKKLSYEDMKKSDNNKYIVKYEITYLSDEGSGFVLTSSCSPDVKFEVSKLELSDEYKEPIYLSLDEEAHKYPLYIQIKNISEQNENEKKRFTLL
jgi:hypothetical protein